MKRKVIPMLVGAFGLVGCQHSTVFGIMDDGPKPPFLQRSATLESARSQAQPNHENPGVAMGLSEMLISTEDTVVASPKVERNLQLIADRLLAQWPGEAPEIRILVSSSPWYNAHAHANHDIIVERGLIETAESEDEVAAVMAHELAHILLHHFQRQELAEAEEKLAKLAITGAVVVAGFSDKESSTRDSAMDVVKVSMIANAVSGRILDPGWAREQEDQADLLAVDLLVKAGYNRDAVVLMLKRMKEAYAQDESNVKKVGDVYKKRMDAYVKVGKIDKVFGTMTEMLGKVAVAAVADLIDFLDDRHATPEQRLAAVQGYIRDYYRRDRVIPMEVGLLRDMKQDRRLIAASQGSEALFAIQTGKTREGEKLARQALRSEDTNPQARMALYFAERGKSGSAKKAVGHLERAARDPYASARVYELLASEYASAGKTDKAIQILDRGEEKLSSPGRLVLTRATLLSGAGRKVEAKGVLRDCSSKQEDRQLGRQCRAMLKEL